MTDVRGTSCFVIKFGKAGEQLAAKLWEEGKMVYASSANPSGKGNRGKVEGIGERIEGAVDLVIEADDYVASIQPDKTIETRYEQGVMVSMVDKDGKLIPDTPTEVEFQLFNSFAKTYRGHGTDLALVAGILGMDTDDPEIPNSLEIAHKRGIKIVWTIQKDSNAPHPNTTKITVKNAHKTISVTGISIGGGNIQVTELNGFAVSLNMNTPTIIIVHQDIPGMIALVTEALSRYGINIAQMNVTREKAGEKAIMIIEVDSRNCDEAIEEIRKIPHLHNVNFFK